LSFLFLIRYFRVIKNDQMCGNVACVVNGANA